MSNQPLLPHDDRLPAVRARLFLLVRSLWKAGIVRVPLTLQGGEMFPALQLLHPLWRRLRVELLGEQLLRDVLPVIERQLASEGELIYSPSRLPPRAPIDWPATWRRQVSRPVLEEASLTVRHWVRLLELPENLLALVALQALWADLNSTLQQPLSEQEAAPLHALFARTSQRLRRPPWRYLAHQFPRAREKAFVAEIVIAATQRIRERLGTRPAYVALLAWWQQWQQWRQPITGPHSLFDPALEPKWLFELLLLFELVATLARHLPLRQTRALAERSTIPVFTAQTAQGTLAIYYQTGSMFKTQRSLTDIWGIPDIVIRLPNEKPSYVILDAKNYAPKGHTQAIYKMLGYLYQFGYSATGEHHFDQVQAGVLAFSTNEREGNALRHWQRSSPNAQAVMSFVLPPLPDERFTGLDEFVRWLLNGN